MTEKSGKIGFIFDRMCYNMLARKAGFVPYTENHTVVRRGHGWAKVVLNTAGGLLV